MYKIKKSGKTCVNRTETARRLCKHRAFCQRFVVYYVPDNDVGYDSFLVVVFIRPTFAIGNRSQLLATQTRP